MFHLVLDSQACHLKLQEEERKMHFAMVGTIGLFASMPGAQSPVCLSTLNSEKKKLWGHNILQKTSAKTWSSLPTLSSLMLSILHCWGAQFQIFRSSFFLGGWIWYHGCLPASMSIYFLHPFWTGIINVLGFWQGTDSTNKWQPKTPHPRSKGSTQKVYF